MKPKAAKRGAARLLRRGVEILLEDRKAQYR